jgi:hypothetical protein
MQTAMTEDVDAVYTWVDAGDPAFQASFLKHAATGEAETDRTSLGLSRYRNNGELRFSLRSLFRYAPWVRRIHILTTGQVPSWLDRGNPRIHLVSHAEVFPEPECLPTFNSNAIEMCLHRIPGLARHFIYFNDDVFLGRAARSSDFFLPGGGQAFYLQDTLVPGNDRQASARDQACAYTQTVLTRLWGEPQTPRFLPAHAPQAYDRDRLAQMESRLHEDFRRTASHRFRAGDDLVLSVLYAHTLREAPEERNRHELPVLPPDDYCFLMLENKWLWVMRAYAKILRRRPRFFCINDDMGDVPAHHPLLLSMRAFLHTYFRDTRAAEEPWQDNMSRLRPYER